MRDAVDACSLRWNEVQTIRRFSTEMDDRFRMECVEAHDSLDILGKSDIELVSTDTPKPDLRALYDASGAGFGRAVEIEVRETVQAAANPGGSRRKTEA